MLSRAVGVTLFVLLVAAVWLSSPELPSPVRLLAVALSTVVPALMLVQLRVAVELPEDVSRGSLYLSSSVTLWVLAAITVAAVMTSGYDLAMIGLVMPAPSVLTAWTLAVLAIGIAWVVVWRFLPYRESPLLRFLLPRSTGERVAFVGVSVTAGLCEELVFRGFLVFALDLIIGSTALAVLFSSVGFGLLHSYQGLVGVFRSATLGALLAVPLVITGSVLPSIVAHAGINIIVGIFLAEWLLRTDHPVEERVPG